MKQEESGVTSGNCGNYAKYLRAFWNWNLDGRAAWGI